MILGSQPLRASSLATCCELMLVVMAVDDEDHHQPQPGTVARQMTWKSPLVVTRLQNQGSRPVMRAAAQVALRLDRESRRVGTTSEGDIRDASNFGVGSLRHRESNISTFWTSNLLLFWSDNLEKPRLANVPLGVPKLGACGRSPIDR